MSLCLDHRHPMRMCYQSEKQLLRLLCVSKNDREKQFIHEESYSIMQVFLGCINLSNNAVPEVGSKFHSTRFGSNSSFLRKVLRRFTETRACTNIEMNSGSMVRGNCRMLKRERDTKALSAVSCRSGSWR